MCLRFAFLLITRVTTWLRLSRCEEAWKTAEILILRHQLAVLERRQLRRLHLNWADRALLAVLLGVIPKARRQGLRLLVTPDTILRWHRDIIRRRWAARSKRGRTGRPTTRRNIKALVLRLARENPGWGYRRIHGELAGLGVNVAASTVWEILKANGIAPAPRRTGTTWPQFLRSEAEAILACDFFTADLLDGTQAHVLTVIEHATRRIRVLGVTLHPTGGMDHPAGPQPPHGPRRPGRAREVHDPRPWLQLHDRVRRGPLRCRDPDRAVQRADAPHERDCRTLDRGMPPRAPGPHPHLEPGPPAADPVRVRIHHNRHRPHRSLHAAAPLKPLPEPVDLEQYRVRRQARVGGLINEYRLVA